jgi:hypothetical protein
VVEDSPVQEIDGINAHGDLVGTTGVPPGDSEVFVLTRL